jgi:hypothetical protein
MLLEIIYAKTDKGREELESRLYHLSAKARRVLILVDAQKTGGDLSAKTGFGDEIKPLLKLLLEEGFITPRNDQVIDFYDLFPPEPVTQPVLAFLNKTERVEYPSEVMAVTRHVKTDKGREELEKRMYGLSAKARRVLILVDAHKTGADLSLLTGFGDQIINLLQLLLDEGFIEPLYEQQITVKPKVPEIEKPKDAVSVPAESVVPPPPPPKPKRAEYPPEVIASAKQLMLDTTQKYLGLLGADVKRRLEAANDADAIVSCVAQWSLALHQSKKGKAAAAEHVQEIQTILGLSSLVAEV